MRRYSVNFSVLAILVRSTVQDRETLHLESCCENLQHWELS